MLTTDVRGRPLSPNTHAHGKVICGVRQKTKNGTVICRNLPIHDGEHKFEPFRNGKKSNGEKTKGRREKEERMPPQRIVCEEHITGEVVKRPGKVQRAGEGFHLR